MDCSGLGSSGQGWGGGGAVDEFLCCCYDVQYNAKQRI